MSGGWLAFLTMLGRSPAAPARADTAWYANGRVAEVRRYDARGRETGEHRGWWEDGTRRFAFEYAAGLMHGRALEWFRDGRVYRDFHYEAGHEAGLQRMWFADGTLRASYVVRDGRRYGLMGAKGCVTR
jgi:antitoxin component YwqK of YwqJK toxin-antitoxin module